MTVKPRRDAGDSKLQDFPHPHGEPLKEPEPLLDSKASSENCVQNSCPAVEFFLLCVC